ncbi:MAG: PAS domain-containing protein, partial [Syntrophothermus sp.]
TPEEIRMLEELAGDLAFGITSLRIKALRIKAENDLRISELRFHTVTDQNRDAIAFMDRDMKKLYVNTAFAALTGVSQEDAVKMSGLELVHPEDKIKVKSLFVEILKNPGSRKSITYRILHADGSCRWIESTGTNLLDDISVGAVIVHSRDITELKEASKKSI